MQWRTSAFAITQWRTSGVATTQHLKVDESVPSIMLVAIVMVMSMAMRIVVIRSVKCSQIESRSNRTKADWLAR
jgi:hypothetical protein